ncbi:DUF4181 domain-containing protein [Fervidibacillus albus]|uniref:DUF4181 domain-containing protein n=1 Tax=Fervidibacillus albus TaxID=2980026 RepID=UPI003B846061
MFLIVAVVLYFRIVYFVKTKWNINIFSSLIYKHVNKVHKAIELSIGIISIVAFYLVIFIYQKNMQPHYILIPLILIYLVRTIMEWKVDKKEYMISGLSVAFLLFVFIITDYFYV